MAKLTGQEIAEKHAKNTRAAIPFWVKGVEAVTESPTAKAAKKLDKYRENVLKALDSGKMERRLLSVSNEDWKAATLKKGKDRLGPGVDAAIPKTAAFHTEFGQHLDSNKASIDAMPDTTLDENIAKMVAQVKVNAAFKRGS